MGAPGRASAAGDEHPGQQPDAQRDGDGGARVVLHVRLHPFAQVAERLGMTASNVGVMLHRVRTALRECVDNKLKAEGLG